MSTVVTTQKPLPYTHEAMVDLIIQDPSVTPQELAELFNRSRAWISKVLAADSFQARLADRKSQLVDPTLAATLNERVTSVTLHALDILADKLEREESASLALDVMDKVSKAAFAPR